MLDIIIGGDLVPTKSNLDYFIHGEINELLGDELLSKWNSSDYRLFNLEVPIADNNEPILKCGPNLIAPNSVIKGIKKLDPSLITLANNHILDQGVQGLNSTINILTESEIPYIGVGNSVNEASKPYIFEKEGIKVGIYACAESEFTIVTKNNPGASPFDPLESLDLIQNLKSKCDYVIVLYHGGKEHYRYPSPYLQKVCRKIVEKGADLVLCQHSHCIGCFEEYAGSTIVYGQGNFIFDRSESELWKTGLLIKVNVDTEFNIEYIPIKKEGNRVRLATEKVAEEILEGFQKRSQDILQESFIEEQYSKFADENIKSYLSTLSGFGKWISRIDRRLLNGMLLKGKYNTRQLLMIQNFIECEAHRELLLRGLKEMKK